MNTEAFMQEALALARQAYALGEAPVGCVVVRQGIIVGRGYNRREIDQSALAHAEIMAIADACRRLQSWRLWDCDLYVTLEPCPMCAGAALQARIQHIYYGASDPKNGACGSVQCIPGAGFTHTPLVTGGLMAEECGQILTHFFTALRVGKQGGAIMTAEQALSRQKLDQINHYLQLSDENFADLQAAAALVRQHPSVWQICYRWWQEVFYGDYDDPCVLALAKKEVPEQMGELHGYFGLLMLLVGFDKLMEIFEKRRIPESIVMHTLTDVETKLSECRQNLGFRGLRGVRLEWLTHHLTGRVFRLGRLQFVHRVLRENLVFGEELILPAGSGVLDIHIPKDGRLFHDSCVASYTMARAFYARYFPEKEVNGLLCHSWLMGSWLREELPPESNIIQFQSDFRIGPPSEPDDSGNMLNCVFQVEYDVKPDYHTLAEGTFLQRKLKQRMLSGKTACAMPGILMEGLIQGCRACQANLPK